MGVVLEMKRHGGQTAELIFAQLDAPLARQLRLDRAIGTLQHGEVPNVVGDVSDVVLHGAGM